MNKRKSVKPASFFVADLGGKGREENHDIINSYFNFLHYAIILLT